MWNLCEFFSVGDGPKSKKVVNEDGSVRHYFVKNRTVPIDIELWNLHFNFTLAPIFSQAILYYIFITIYFASTTKISLLDLVKTSDSSFPTLMVSSILMPYLPGK